MSTQPTNQPVPSESPRDLKFNAGKIDEFVTSMGWTYTDRFGGKHYTIEGINHLAQQVMSAFGYVTLPGVTFTTGATVSTPNEVLFNTADNSYYKWTGSFASGPKVVPANSTPASTGGVGPGKWLSVADSTLRGELASDSGAGHVGTSSGNTVQEELDTLLHAYNKGISTFDIGSRAASGESVKIVIYGDSTVDGTNTTGWTANATDASGNAIGGSDHNITAPNTWPVYLQTILRDMFGSSIDVKNAGYGGKSIIDNWAKNNYQKAVVDTYGIPDYVFISFGLNDVTQGIYTTDLFYQRYGELIDLVIESGATPVVITSDPVSFSSGRNTMRVQGEMVNAQKYIANIRGLQCIDINAGLIKWQNLRNDNDRWAYQQNDGLHFSDLGHYKRAEISAKEISGLVINGSETTKIAPWQGRQNVYPNNIFRTVNNFYAGCLNYSNQNNIEIIDFYIWCDRNTNLIYHSVDRDISAASIDVSTCSKIRVKNIRTGAFADTPIYFGSHAGLTSNRMSEIPLKCSSLKHGINKVTYVSAPLSGGICSVGFLTLSTQGSKTVSSVGSPSGTSYAISAEMYSVDNPISYSPSVINAYECTLNLPVGFGAILTKCRTFNNGTDVTLDNQQSMLILYRDSDDSVGLYNVVYNASSGITVALLNKSAASIYKAGMILEVRTGLSGTQQIIQVYQDVTKIIEYTNPSSSTLLPVSGVPGGIFANKTLATGFTGYASITYL